MKNLLASLVLLFLATAGFAEVGTGGGVGVGPSSAVAGVSGKAIAPSSVTTGAVTDSGLTAGRVPYAGTAGLLQDAGTLLYAPTTGLTADQLTSSGLTSGRITTAGAAGKLQDFAGLTITGTPSTTAPSAATNAPASVNGIVAQYDGSSGSFSGASFGNGASQANEFGAWACQGTAASPGATISSDRVFLALRGHDGTNFTAAAGSVTINANSTWTTSNHESFIQFATTANGSTTLTAAGRVDPNQTLVWGSASNGSGTFSAGTQRPHIQTSSTSAANCNVAQSLWANATTGPTGIFAKSRSTTVGTQSVITTGDTLGTLSYQGDDGTNFIEAASIVVTATGTLGTGQIPGSLAIKVANSAGTNAARLTITATSATFASGTPLTVSDTTASTSGSTGAIIASGGIGAAGAVWSSLAPAAATTPAHGAAGTSALVGGVTDAYTSGIRLTPGYSGVQTVTRHNYIDLNNPSLSSTTLTDACVFRFDANVGTHKALDAASTKTTPGTVNGWLKINVNGTLFFIPLYTSKTSWVRTIPTEEFACAA